MSPSYRVWPLRATPLLLKDTESHLLPLKTSATGTEGIWCNIAAGARLAVKFKMTVILENEQKPLNHKCISRDHS